MTQDIEPSTVAYFNVLMLLELGVTVVVCTDSSADTVANRSRPWLRLIALLGLTSPSNVARSLKYRSLWRKAARKRSQDFPFLETYIWKPCASYHLKLKEYSYLYTVL